MQSLPPAVPAEAADPVGRPARHLGTRALLRLSIYWLGLSSIFSGLNAILTGRVQFEGLVRKGEEGSALFVLTIAGAFIAIVVQPTVGTLSDYTATRWGRRKPYILVGSLLDVVFLAGIATSHTLLAIAAFMVLLQFSSNAAQGPFQGYVPDLVPDGQVGLASALVGAMQILGSVTGFVIGAIAISTNSFALGTIALAAVELVTMLGVILRVPAGPPARPRGGRSWLAVAREAWGTDILREHSFLWLVGSRLFVLMGTSVLVNLATFYLAQVHGLTQDETGRAFLVVTAIVAVTTVLTVVPAGRISDRVGRKPLIYVSCVFGAVGVGIVALAPVLVVAFFGVGLVGISAGMFLAVDWALMTDIIPKAASGRYMGMSNVATGSAGVLSIAIGGRVMDIVNGLAGYGTGPRAGIALGVVFFIIGALLLRPVNEARHAPGEAHSSSGTLEGVADAHV